MKKTFLIIFLFFLAAGILNDFEKYIYPIEYEDIVCKYSKEFKLEPELVFAVIKAESGFDKDAVSRKKAIGLMQLMTETAASGAKALGIKAFNEKMLFEPDINIRIGCWYLRQLYSEHISMPAVIVAYNAGGKNLKNWFADIDYKTLSNDQLSKNIKYGETRLFLERVINNYKMYKKIYIVRWRY